MRPHLWRTLSTSACRGYPCFSLDSAASTRKAVSAAAAVVPGWGLILVAATGVPGES